MNFEDACVKDDFQSFEVGKLYAIRLKDMKKLSYTNLNEPYYDFDLSQVMNEEKKYGKVNSSLMLNFGNLIKNYWIYTGIVPVKYLGNNSFQDIETGDMIIHLNQFTLESFPSLEQVEEDIATYHNHYLCVELGAIYPYDEKVEQKYRKFRSKFDDITELFDMLNKQAEQSLQINFIRLETNEMIDTVYEGKTEGKSKKLVKEMQAMKRKIVK